MKSLTAWNQSDQSDIHVDDEAFYPIPEAFGICMQLVGFIENIVVVVLLFSRPMLRKRAHEFFILCLSFSDLLACSTNLIYYIPIYAKTDLSSETFCKMIYIGWILWYGSSLFMGFVISLERFNAVKSYPRYKVAGNYQYYVTILPTTLLMTYIVIIVASVETTGNYHHCKLERMYSYENMLIMLVCTQLVIILPLVTLTILLYVAAVYRLARLLRTQQRDATERHRFTAKVNAIPSNYTHLKLKLKPANLKPLSSHLQIDKQCNQLVNIPFQWKSGKKMIHHVRNHSKFKNRCTKRTKELKTALITVLIILITLFFTFAPHSVLKMLKLAHVHLPVMELVTRLVLVAHPVVNPILYVWRIKTIRKEFSFRKII